MDVLVVNLLCFIVQKFLIQQSRPVQKRQDVLCVYDTIEPTAPCWMNSTPVGLHASHPLSENLPTT